MVNRSIAIWSAHQEWASPRLPPTTPLRPALPNSAPPHQDAREDLAGTEVVVAQLQAQVDALMAAGEMAAQAAAQLDNGVSALEVRRKGSWLECWLG